MEKIIGFARQYYTLWNLSIVPVFSTVNGKHIKVGDRYNYTYIQNLSKDEESAIAKVKQRFNLNFVDVDESLRGVTQRSFSRYVKMSLPFTVFPFGKLMHENIIESNDVWQLMRVYEGEGATGGYDEHLTSIPVRRRVLARRRLIELGELVRYDHQDSKWVGNNLIDFNNKYATKATIDRLVKIKESKWLHSDGERIDLRLKEVKRFGFETQFGWTTVVTYVSDDGNEYIYKGGSAPSMSEEFINIKATIKHSEYRGVKQTMLQRIKIL